jgi:hypothetical protein
MEGPDAGRHRPGVGRQPRVMNAVTSLRNADAACLACVEERPESAVGARAAPSHPDPAIARAGIGPSRSPRRGEESRDETQDG